MIQLNVPTGKYVVAVSGGVDSVVLLDVLSKQKDLELIVTHFDHGIRPDSAADQKFVAALAKKYHLAYEYTEGKLGAKASEEAARKARYKFLHAVQAKRQTKAIITAHHQDDVLETLIMNVLRGTKHTGLVSLKDHTDIMRPLLQIPKSELLSYATKHRLAWHEDSTNQDTTYKRNWVRHQIIPKLTPVQRQQLLGIHGDTKTINETLGQELAEFFDITGTQLERLLFISLPHDLASEVMASWLRKHGIRDFDRKTIERLVISSKTGRAGQVFDVKQGYSIKIMQDSLKLVRL